MHVVATAGHVDHGKSTLVRLLTGMEPDRWAEEQRRGMTIDLGFAWTTLPAGETVAFVDVPGHERFVANMLAGAGPVPAVLLVVAADEGWMPQTQEHVEVLDALGVQHGLVAVSRADLADPAAVAADVRRRLAATSLAGSPTVAVSGRTGAGLDAVREGLTALVRALPAPRPDARVRLWIDRAFTVKGAGTIVTGTLPAGTLRVGDALDLLPSGQRVHIRGLESLKQRAAAVTAVSRVALRLRGVDLADLSRGQPLVSPDSWLAATDVDVRVTAADLPSELVLHIGSAAVPVWVRPLGASHARLTLSSPLPLQIGDRAVLRDPGRRLVAAGARVLDVLPPPLKRRGAAAARVVELEKLTGVPDADDEVRRRGLVRASSLQAMGADEEPTHALAVAGWWVDPGTWQGWQAGLVAAVAEQAATDRVGAGLSRDQLRHRLRLPDPQLVDALISRTPAVAVRAGRVVDAAAAELPPDLEQRLAVLATALAATPFAAPDAATLSALGLDAAQLAAATRAGRLLRLADGVYLLPGAEETAVDALGELPQPFTVSDARQALGTSRRVAVPLLEHLDARRRIRRLDASTREVVR